MEKIVLSFFDWCILLVYICFIVWMGFYLKRFTRTHEDFFLAGRRNSMWVCGIAFMSANMGAMEVIGYAGQSVKYGMYAAHFYLIGAIPAMLFLGVFMMPFYYHSKIKSIPGYLKERFNESTRVLNALMFVVNMILVSGISLYLLALVLHTFLGWSWHISIWLAATFVAIYVTLSGLLSAMFTEIIQFFLIWASILLLPILGFVDIGGPAEIGKKLSEAYTTLWSTSVNPSDNAMFVTWGGLLLGLGFGVAFGYWTTDFLIIQRAFSAKDLRSARMTPIIGSYFKLLLGAVVVSSGMIALTLLKEPSSGFNLLVEHGNINYDSVMPLLMKRYFPTGIIGVGVTSLVAMFMAGMAGNMSAFNTVWTYDIYHSVINKNASHNKLMHIGRYATVSGILLSVVGAYIAKSMPTVIDYLQAISSMFLAPSVAVILLGMFIKWITPKGGFWGMLTGTSSSVGLFLAQQLGLISTGDIIPVSSGAGEKAFMAANFWRSFWAWLIAAGVAIIVSLFTEKKSEEKLKGFVKGLTEKVEIEKEYLHLYQKPGFWASITLIIFIAINLYFW
ncbi:Na+/galactose cotransporter [candidate division KSB1 bacterium]|nr:MAG: Na+/galactose cotransporter [candidate division KSB1 bacterium]